MPPSWTSIVRIGSAETSSALQLRQAIVSFLGSPPTKEDEDSVLQVSNRYFKAKVRLEDIGSGSNEDLWKEDGIILVFANAPSCKADTAEAGDSIQSSHDDVFRSLTVAHDYATDDDAIAPAGDLLRLCVALSSEPLSEKNTKQYELEYARRIHWCLDRGYEYVECDLLDLDKGHDDRDKEGFARIIEAIRGTVWSSAVMEQSKTSHLKMSYQQDKVAVVDATDDKSYNEYVPPDPTKFSSINDAGLSPTTEDDMEREEQVRRELLSTCEVESAVNVQGQREQDDEHIFNSMESVLKQAASIREASRAGTMTHDERRKRAGDAAALLYQLMGDMGFEESDDDDEQEGSEDDVVDEDGVALNGDDAVASL